MISSVKESLDCKRRSQRPPKSSLVSKQTDNHLIVTSYTCSSFIDRSFSACKMQPSRLRIYTHSQSDKNTPHDTYLPDAKAPCEINLDALICTLHSNKTSTQPLLMNWTLHIDLGTNTNLHPSNANPCTHPMTSTCSSKILDLFIPIYAV